MELTVTVDEDLYAQAQAYAGVTFPPVLVHKVLKSFVEREAARRLILIGGTDPDSEAAPRRRPPPAAPARRFEMQLLDSRLPGWGFPHRGSAGSAGLDLHACLAEPLTLAPGEPAVMISAGFALRIADPGWCGLVAPRSGLGHRGLVLGNGIGVIDSDYEGPITVSAWNRNAPGLDPITIEPGDRIAQLLFVPVAHPELEIVDVFEGQSDRGEGGFGSTGVAGSPP